MADFSRLPGPNADLWDWQLLAACRGVDSSLFFHPEGERGAARSAREASAKEVCMRCPVRTTCAQHALTVREPYGVWGGLTEDEREELMGRARNRQVQHPPTAAPPATDPAPAAPPASAPPVTAPQNDPFPEVTTVLDEAALGAVAPGHTAVEPSAAAAFEPGAAATFDLGRERPGPLR